jgi:hypothetical protein
MRGFSMSFWFNWELKPRQVNVLVAPDNSPLLCDFGLSAARYSNLTNTSSPDGGSFRWMAVELLMNEHETKPSIQSDM